MWDLAAIAGFGCITAGAVLGPSLVRLPVVGPTGVRHRWAIPALPLLDRRPSPPRLPVDVPLAFPLGLPVLVGDVPWLVDTGAALSGVTPQGRARLGWDEVAFAAPLRPYRLRGLGGGPAPAASFAVFEPLEVGPLAFPRVRLCALPQVVEGLGGIVGARQLAVPWCLLDFQSGRLRMEGSAVDIGLGPGSLRARRRDCWRLDGRVEGHAAEVLLDTGAMFSSIGPGLPFSPLGGERVVDRGVQGETAPAERVQTSLEVADRHFTGAFRRRASGPPNAVILGMDHLVGRKIVMTPSHIAISEPGPRPSSWQGG